MDTKTVQICQLCKLEVTILCPELKAVWICDRCMVRGNPREIQRLFGN